MKTAGIIILVIYLIGLVVAFSLLVQDVEKSWYYRNKKESIKSTFRNTWDFYIQSWVAVFWILMKRKL